MNPLREHISSVRREAAAQRIKAAELRRRASWWRPLTRALMRLDADALEHGAAYLERLATRWEAVADLYPTEILVVDLDGPLDPVALSDALDRHVAALHLRDSDA